MSTGDADYFALREDINSFLTKHSRLTPITKGKFYVNSIGCLARNFNFGRKSAKRSKKIRIKSDFYGNIGFKRVNPP
jgi:hypothetical protein